MSYGQATNLGNKSKQNDLPEKDLSCVQTNKQTKPNMSNLNSQQQQTPSTSSLQSLLMNRPTQQRIQTELPVDFLSSLPETSRLLAQTNMQTPYLSSSSSSSSQLYSHIYAPHLNHHQPYMQTNERLVSSLNHLALNEKLFNPSLSSILSNNSNSNSINNPLNSSESINESIIRRDNEIDRLKMRILLLEQQMQQTNNTPSSSNMISVPKQDAYEMRFKNFEMEAAILRNQYNAYSTNKQAVADLESLLNQREYEIQELKSKYSEETKIYDRELTKLKNLVNGKEEELINERGKNTNFQKEIEKLHSKLTECNKYIGELPTKDEVVVTEKQMSDLKTENEALKQKLNDFEKRVNKAKLFIKEKNVEINDLKDKIEKVELDKEKVKLEFENYKRETQSVGELLERCEQNASLRAELDCAKKFLTSMQEKLKLQESKHQDQIAEIKEKLKLEADLNESLRYNLESKDSLIKNLEKSVKDSMEQNQSLMNENLNLSEKIKSLETVLSADSLKLLKLLFKELNTTTHDLDILVINCIDIYNGKQIDICSLLGTTSQNSYDLIDTSRSDSIISLINTEYLQKRISDLRELRKKLDNVKKMITDEYAEKIGNNISCMMQ